MIRCIPDFTNGAEHRMEGDEGSIPTKIAVWLSIAIANFFQSADVVVLILVSLHRVHHDLQLPDLQNTLHR